MSDRQSLIDALRSARVVLLELRKLIEASGHLGAMADIDTFVSLAQNEADHLITTLARRRPDLPKP